jgi:hypothetical protein
MPSPRVVSPDNSLRVFRSVRDGGLLPREGFCSALLHRTGNRMGRGVSWHVVTAGIGPRRSPAAWEALKAPYSPQRRVSLGGRRGTGEAACRNVFPPEWGSTVGDASDVLMQATAQERTYDWLCVNCA